MMDQSRGKEESWLDDEQVSSTDASRRKAIQARNIEEVVLLGEHEIRKQNAAAMRALRETAAEDVMALFKTANLFVLVAVGFASVVDYTFIAFGVYDSDERLIGNEVLMALIGATTVQLGAVMYTVYRYLFPSSEELNE